MCDSDPGVGSNATGKLPHAPACVPTSAPGAAASVTQFVEGANEAAHQSGLASSSGGPAQSSAEARSRRPSKLGIGDFAVMGKLGEGGYGTVLLARHKTTHLMYALKMQLKARIQSDIQAERVLSEAQALLEVQHPFIVSMLGATAYAYP